MKLKKTIPEYQGKTSKDMWIVGNLFTDSESGKMYILPCSIKFLYNRKSFENYEVIPASVGKYICKADCYDYPLYTGDKVSLILTSKNETLAVNAVITFSTKYQIYHLITDDNRKILFEGDTKYKISLIEKTGHSFS